MRNLPHLESASRVAPPLLSHLDYCRRIFHNVAWWCPLSALAKLTRFHSRSLCFPMTITKKLPHYMTDLSDLPFAGTWPLGHVSPKLPEQWIVPMIPKEVKHMESYGWFVQLYLKELHNPFSFPLANPRGDSGEASGYDKGIIAPPWKTTDLSPWCLFSHHFSENHFRKRPNEIKVETSDLISNPRSKIQLGRSSTI